MQLWRLTALANLSQELGSLIAAQRSTAGTHGPAFAVVDQEYEIVP
jgi:hypothetical protein